MKIKDHRQMMRSLTDPLNIPKLRALLEAHPVLTQEEFRARQSYKPGGLVEPGVMHYGRPVSPEVQATKDAVRAYYNKAIKNKEYISIKKILDNVSGSNDMMIRRVLNKNELAGLYKETKITAPETGKIQARKVAANQIKAYEAIAKNSNLTVAELAKKLKLTKKETNRVLSNLVTNIYKHRRELTTGETPPKKVGETAYRKLPPGKSSSAFLNDYKLDDVKNVLNSIRDNDDFVNRYQRSIYEQVLEAFEGKPKQLKEANRRLNSWFEVQKQFKKQYPKLYKDFASGLDHPLSFRNLEAVGATAENMVRINPIPQKINIGIKAGLDAQYGKINALIRKEGATPELLKRKKAFEGLVKNLGLTMGKTGPGGDKVIVYGGESILKGGLGDKMIKNLGLKTTVYKNIKKMEKAGTLEKAVSDAYGGKGSFYKSLQNVRPDDPKKLAQAKTALKGLIEKIGCPGLAAGGRASFKDGSTCYTRGMEKIQTGKITTPGERANFTKLAQTLGPDGWKFVGIDYDAAVKMKGPVASILRSAAKAAPKTSGALAATGRFLFHPVEMGLLPLALVAEGLYANYADKRDLQKVLDEIPLSGEYGMPQYKKDLIMEGYIQQARDKGGVGLETYAIDQPNISGALEKIGFGDPNFLAQTAGQAIAGKREEERRAYEAERERQKGIFDIDAPMMAKGGRVSYLDGGIVSLLKK